MATARGLKKAPVESPECLRCHATGWDLSDAQQSRVPEARVQDRGRRPVRNLPRSGEGLQVVEGHERPCACPQSRPDDRRREALPSPATTISRPPGSRTGLPPRTARRSASTTTPAGTRSSTRCRKLRRSEPCRTVTPVVAAVTDSLSNSGVAIHETDTAPCGDPCSRRNRPTPAPAEAVLLLPGGGGLSGRRRLRWNVAAQRPLHLLQELPYHEALLRVLENLRRTASAAWSACNVTPRRASRAS